MTKQLTVSQATQALLSTLFGVGLYNTPYTFARSGIMIGLLTLSTTTVFTIFSILFMFFFAKAVLEGFKQQQSIELHDFTPPNIENTTPLTSDPEQGEVTTLQKSTNKETTKEMSYSSLGSIAVPHLGKVISCMITISGISTCLFFQKFISEIILRNLFDYSNEDVIGKNIYRGFVFAYGIILLGLGQIKTLSKISWLGTVNIVCISVIGAIVFALNFLLNDFIAEHSTNNEKGLSLYAISIFVFAMAYQSNVVKVFADLKEKSVKNLTIIAAFASLVACIIYGFMGIIGSRLFGDLMLKEDILTMFSDRKSEINNHIYDKFSELIFLRYLISGLGIIGLIISFTFQLSAVTRSITNHQYI